MRLERERQTELGDADAERIQFLAPDPKVVEALHQVVVRLPSCSNTQASAFAGSEHLVHWVDAREFPHRGEPSVIHLVL